MVRVMLICAALLVAGEGWAIDVYDRDTLNELLAIEAGIEDTTFIRLTGALWTLEGSWEEGTAELVGHLKDFDAPGGILTPNEILPEVIHVPLPRTNSWSVWYTPLGYGRGMIPENYQPDFCEGDYRCAMVGLTQLNDARNYFGHRREDNRFNRPHPSDLTYDDVTDIDDLNTVRNRFGTPLWLRLDLPSSSSAIPEPSTVMLLALSLSGLAARRGRSRCRS